MTISAESVERRQITEEQFALLFQVTKEFPNLSGAVVNQVIRGSGEARALVAAARMIRDRLKTRSIGEDVIAEFDVAARIDIVDRTDDFGGLVIYLSCERPTLTKWKALADAVCEQLGAREFFLRTGFQIDDYLELSDVLHC